MSLRSSISDAWRRFQGELFPALAGEVGPLGVRHGRFIAVLDLVEVERHVHYSHRGVGNPPADRPGDEGPRQRPAVRGRVADAPVAVDGGSVLGAH